MNTKNILVSFQAIVIALLLVVTVSATNIDLADPSNVIIKVDGIEVNNDVAVIAGETVDVKVYFTSIQNATDVRIKASIEGDKLDVSEVTSSFDVEEGKRYSKTLTLKVPYELKDVLSDDLGLSVKIWNGDYKTEYDNDNIVLRVQRPTYNADVKSVNVPQNIEAGDNIPVDVVLKNIGYNDLNDVYVTASISELGLKETSYFGDLVAIECGDNDEDENPEDLYGVAIDRKCNEDDQSTMSGRLYLEVPYSVKDGIYTLEVEVTNDDATSKITKQITVSNNLAENVIATSTKKNAVAGESAEYNLLIVNPTDKVQVYRIVTESNGDLSTSVDEAVVAVQAGSSKTVKITASAKTEGEYNFNVDVLSGNDLVDSITLSLKAEKGSLTEKNSPIVILTVVLAIIFLVLLVVLIVLIGKKPGKSEEFGESYY